MSLHEFFSLQRGEADKAEVFANVRSNISFTGANLWILACAILVASIGLNVNSTAVIIGAMLISPLMGPIVGAGFALGTYDFALLQKSLRNLAIATLASLLVSTLYFSLSPFKEAQAELLARTSPTIFDVLIAFFGGLVGVIALTRTEKGNPIPGVAIATALMPPLCTAGYGLAIRNEGYALGALFLYVINCVFICIATFLIVKLLRYPAITQVNERQQALVKYGISALIILLVLPSSYWAYTLYQAERFQQRAHYFLEREITAHGATLIFRRLRAKANPRIIEIAVWQKRYAPAQLAALQARLPAYQLDNTQLVIRQESNAELETLRADLLNELGRSGKVVDERDQRIAALEKELAKYQADSQGLLRETQVLFPAIQAISVAPQQLATATQSTEAQPIAVQAAEVMIVYYEAASPLSAVELAKLAAWLKTKLAAPELRLATAVK